MTFELNDILSDSRVAAISDLRRNHGDRARDAQMRYRRFSRLFIAATAAAALAGAMILYGAGGEAAGATPGGTSSRLVEWLAVPRVRTLLFVVQVASLAGAAYAAEMLRETRVGSDWMEERRQAETLRVDLFDQIMAAAAEQGPEAERAAFAHFAEEQLASQLHHHATAEATHRRSAGRSAVWGGLIAAVVAASGAAGVGGPGWIAIAALIGVIAPIALNALRTWRESSLDREKSARYRATWVELRRLSAELDAATRALDQGDPALARDLVARVHAVMRAEHEGWTPTGAKP